jgi:hypothetical protein
MFTNYVPEIDKNWLKEQFEIALRELDSHDYTVNEPDVFSDALGGEKYHRMKPAAKAMKNYAMRIGFLHQAIAGQLPGWNDLVLGEGVDVRSDDEQTNFYIKNKANTWNSSSKAQELTKIDDLRARGKTAYAVLINCKSKNIKDSRIIDGKEFYKMVSGREDFFDHLVETFKSYQESIAISS